jgi:hypothetical protein
MQLIVFWPELTVCRLSPLTRPLWLKPESGKRYNFVCLGTGAVPLPVEWIGSALKHQPSCAVKAAQLG